MKFITVPVILAGLAVAAPAPVTNPDIPESWKRSMEANLEMVRRESQLSDTDILNFALTLEHLEDTFYQEALNMFSQDDFDAAGYIARLRTNIGEVSTDETTHVAVLSGALGENAVPACEYEFGLTDVESFMRTAQILEGVGVTAYLGAAALITDPTYLTVAGSILTVEARHSAYLRDSQIPPQSPFPQPFDVPLSVREVFTLASGFITSCPAAADLGIEGFPTLALRTKKFPLRPGMDVTFDVQEGTLVDAESAYANFITVTGPVPADLTVLKGGKRVRITIPKGVAGQSYVVVTKSAESTDDGDIIAGPGIVMVQAKYTYGGFPKLL